MLVTGDIELLGVPDRVETLAELLNPFDLVIPAAILGRQPHLMRACVYENAHILSIRRKPSKKP